MSQRILGWFIALVAGSVCIAVFVVVLLFYSSQSRATREAEKRVESRNGDHRPRLELACTLEKITVGKAITFEWTATNVGQAPATLRTFETWGVSGGAGDNKVIEMRLIDTIKQLNMPGKAQDTIAPRSSFRFKGFTDTFADANTESLIRSNKMVVWTCVRVNYSDDARGHIHKTERWFTSYGGNGVSMQALEIHSKMD